MTITPWTVHSSQCLVQDRWLTLRADRCESQDGVSLDPYDITKLRNWVPIVAFDQHHQVLLTKQYRHGRRETCVELPYDMVEDQEEPSAAVRSELP